MQESDAIRSIRKKTGQLDPRGRKYGVTQPEAASKEPQVNDGEPQPEGASEKPQVKDKLVEL